jgi:hypothetical protein
MKVRQEFATLVLQVIQVAGQTSVYPIRRSDVLAQQLGRCQYFCRVKNWSLCTLCIMDIICRISLPWDYVSFKNWLDA